MGTEHGAGGGYVLAGELAAADGDHRVAFPRYEQEMRAYVTRNQRRPPGGTSGFAPRTKQGIRLRNGYMRLMMRLPVKHLMMGGIQRSASSIALKDYR